MKSDQALVDRLLRRLGVPFEVKVGEYPGQNEEPPPLIHLMIGGRGMDDLRVHGYAGFMTEFVFTEAGEFCYMGLWE